MSRHVNAQSVVYDQLDFFIQSSGIRQTGIISALLDLKLFVNNQLLPWTLVDGSNTPDSSISVGKIYFNEIYNNPGYYSVRFFPDRIGFWRLSFVKSDIELIKEFDIISSATSTGSLNASFI